MAESQLVQRQRLLLRELVQMKSDRADGEKAAEEGFRARKEAADKEFAAAHERITNGSRTDEETLTKEYEKVRQAIAQRVHTQRQAADRTFGGARRRLLRQFDAKRKSTEGEYSVARWSLATNLEKAIAQSGPLQELSLKIAERQQDIRTLREEAGRFLGRTFQEEEEAQEEEDPANLDLPQDKPYQQLEDLVAYADGLLSHAKGSVFGKVCRAVGVPLGGTARKLSQALAEADVFAKRCQRRATAKFKRQFAKHREQFEADQRRLDNRYLRQLLDLEVRHEMELRQEKGKYRKKLLEVKDQRDKLTRQAEDKYPRLLKESKELYAAEARQAGDRHQHLVQENQARHEADKKSLAANWQERLLRVEQGVADISALCGRLFPSWNDGVWNNWQAPAELPPAVRFGEFVAAMPRLEGVRGQGSGVGEAAATSSLTPDPRPPTPVLLPALLGFPDPCSMVFEAKGDGRLQAEVALQVVMFRLLAAVPPGKVRFTIVDPVGLGRNFAAFMHLADHDELLVNSRIWTEQEHISQRLNDLTAHMENVIQKFLRNQFETIEEYNANAGEVAEPFRVLVVANFPVNFTAEAARRLASIATGGPRCGVHVLVTVDTGQTLPHEFDLADLEKYAASFVWQDQRFSWKDADFGKFPFRLDAPPDPDFVTRILQQVGKLAKLASRVEVPFDFIAPPSDNWWHSDSRAGVDVPLGRAGATKRQHLMLGKGTSQHVLIAGKTGSGKSTLLHALITNISLLYSPDEIALYLVDFKEGVEFKPYATNELPHARVVAIESEREFGLSVLQRLEEELKERGEKFRAVGVQDLNGYRNANGATPLPRILLIVDEFQLFFVEEDKIAQDAALLLDRLVRQGRAFGIHVLLGSQTLGGAYSLARSTIGQMTVRIALQCSEADTNLILSEDNSAARLLSRPGEAIYNDANGLVEGNDYFQVVWLSEDQRVDYLQRIRDMAVRRRMVPPQPQIVFEGSAPADPRKNVYLQQFLEAPAWPSGEPRSTLAWLGEAVAIKDPTAAMFHPQSGSNLLMVGQDDEACLAMMATAIVGLAAQHPSEASRAGSVTDGEDGARGQQVVADASGSADSSPLTAVPRFFVLDGSPADVPNAGFFNRLPQVLPHPMRIGGWRDMPALIGDLAEEVERRQKSPESTPSFIYLFVYSLQRFRELRPAEDDFGFGRKEEKPSPSKQFSTILKEGPNVGVFTIIWCDSLNNLNRSLDRQGLREFEMRVLFQMSAQDSSNLIDLPLASKLGQHRAVFFSEDRGQPEKFRPYQLPTAEWLAWVKEQAGKKRVAVEVASARS
jgi:hypothetical protein